MGASSARQWSWRVVAVIGAGLALSGCPMEESAAPAPQRENVDDEQPRKGGNDEIEDQGDEPAPVAPHDAGDAAQSADAGSDARVSDSDGGDASQLRPDANLPLPDAAMQLDASAPPVVNDECTALLGNLKSAFASAGTLVDCHQVAGGGVIADSLFRHAGMTIDNQGSSMKPCVAVRCDAKYAYIAGNSVPHYDFVPMTPNALVATPRVYRIPLAPVPVATQAGAQNAGALLGCQAAYNQYMFDARTGTTSDPSGLCQTSDGAASYLYDALSSGRRDYQRLPCGFATSVTISGVAAYGPNEAATPDPWGNPSYNYPNDSSDSYGIGAALDLCGGHVGDAMHYHATKAACFERAPDGKPLFSYREATEDFDLGAALKEDCSEPSPVVGWSADGYPIKGPCVCLERASDGSCSKVRKARSSWIYAGLRDWGSDAQESTLLGVEGMPCVNDTQCCSSKDCDFSCSYAVTNDSAAPGGSTVDKRCVQINYAWCVHKFVARPEVAPPGANFAYLDRCNGLEGPDGYAYHATASFPLLQGCYRGQVGGTREWIWSQSTGAGGPPGGGMTGGGATTGGGMTGGGGTTGGGIVPACSPGQLKCCGDGVCDGPETTLNCSRDCH